VFIELGGDMNEWLKKLLDQVKALWAKWSTLQKGILGIILVGSVVAVVLLIMYSSSPSKIPLIDIAIQDQQRRHRIVTRLAEEGVEYEVTEENKIYVYDKDTAMRMRSVLIREDLIPEETDPWAIFDVERWTQTDFERNVNLRRAITESLKQHIRALDYVDAVSINLVMPEDELFAENQNPVTASIIVTPKPGTDLEESRDRIEGIEKLIMMAVEGLEKDNITITNHNGVVLNDFTGLEKVDRINLAEREIKLKEQLEQTYKKSILNSLHEIFGQERVQIINLDISMDMGKKTVETEEHFPVTMRKDNPSTPYDETEVIPSITLSKSSEDINYEGTGFNPEGPPGQEGQTPPSYKDLQNMAGSYKKESLTQNEAVNTRNIYEEKSPWSLDRISVGVAISGIWKRKYDESGNLIIESDGSIKRDYFPVDEEELDKAEELVRHAIGYNQNRGDAVTVQHLQFDRSEEFRKEDEKYRSQMIMRRTILYVLIGLAIILVSFIVFRLVSREVERRRRLREEELSRQHQAMREQALKSAEEEGVDVEMSVEEKARLEMQEQAINMAREHPEDVAQLIRTWLVEE